MPHNLWIGRPGALREIDQAAKSWDRTAELGVSEFRALGGRATVVYTPKPVRKLKLSWDSLDASTAAFLDRLARRVDGPGPFAVLDPASVNLLEQGQAAGMARAGSDGLSQWFVSGQPGKLVESTVVPGAFSFQAQAADSAVAWRHPLWTGIPVVAGMTVSFRIPTAFPSSATACLDFKSVTGGYLSSAVVSGRQVTATVPDGAAFVTPVAKPGAIGTSSLAGACFTIGGDWPDETRAGDGCPPMAITGYTDSPAQHLPYRNISIDLLEVGSALG